MRMDKVMMTPLATVAAFVSVGTASAWEYSYWDPAGSGGWSDATRWIDGKLPTQTENVNIRDAEAFATDADFGLMTGLTRIRLSGEAASLDLRLDEDHEGAFNSLQLENRESTTKATVYKSGTGVFFHTSGGFGFYFDAYCVTNGELRLRFVESQTNMVYGAFAPGRLVFDRNADIAVKGLDGDGDVSAIYPRTTFLWGDVAHQWADGTPFAFSGTLGANMNLAICGGRHHFTGLTSENLTVRLLNGELGVGTFGRNGEAGSVGSAPALTFGGSATLLYLGAGETTDKTLVFGADAAAATVDAGAHGGVTFGGTWDASAASDLTLTLAGSNTADSVLAADLAGASGRLALVKRGVGTWDLAAVPRAAWSGPVRVAEGVLKAASLAPQGEPCALGTATGLDAGAALELGTPATTGTVAYTGTAYAQVRGRAVTVAGTGHLVGSAAGGVVNFFDVTAAGTAGGTLELDGSGAFDGVNDVRSGAGPLGLAKAGAGTWSLGGTVDVVRTDVKEGTLVVNNASDRYAYYRFTVTELWGGRRLQIGEFALFDADGARVNANLVVADENGKPYALNPGEAQDDGAFGYRNTSLANLFDETAGNGFIDGYCAKTPSRTDPKTWQAFTLRLAADARSARSYDIQASQGYNPDKQPGDAWNANHMCNFEVRGWRVEASVDGRSWALLDEQYLDGPPLSGTGRRWYAVDATDADRSERPGYLFGNALPPSPAVSLGVVSVAGGARLVADAPVEIAALRIDATSAGSLSNVMFAASGTLDITGLDGMSAVLPLAFADGTDLAPLLNWTLKLDGEVSNKYQIGVSGGQVTLRRRGCLFIIR